MNKEIILNIDGKQSPSSGTQQKSAVVQPQMISPLPYGAICSKTSDCENGKQLECKGTCT